MRIQLAAVATAVALASAGSATAGSLITGSKIKDNSLTGADIRNGSISEKDMAKRSIRAFQGTEVLRVSVSDTIAPAPTLSSANTTTLEAKCPAGTVATGGGATLRDYPRYAEMRTSAPTFAPSGEPNGWSASMVFASPTGSGGPAQDTMQVYALCTATA